MDILRKQKYGSSYYDEIFHTLGEEKTSIIWKDANDRYQKLLEENRELSDKVKSHTDTMIFPAIAVYKAIQATDPKSAMSIMERAEDNVSIKTGTTYRKFTKTKFMRKLFLKIFSWGAKKGFSDSAGFINEFEKEKKNELMFKMKKCPYNDYCIKYGCPELTHIFCHNDINTYGNLPGITFKRHETLGTGGTCCDFHLYTK